MVALADRLGASHLATGSLRAPRGRRLRAAARARRPTRRRTRPTCSRAFARRRSRGFGSRWASSPSPRSARARPRRGTRGRLEAREPGPLLPRGRGQALVPRAARRARRPARRDRGRRRRGRWASTPATTTSRSASAAGWAWRPASRSTCSATDASANRVIVGGREELRDHDRAPARRPPPPRLGTRRPVKLRYHAHAIPCRVSPRARGRARGARARARRACVRRRAGPDRLPSTTATWSSAAPRSRRASRRLPRLSTVMTSAEIRETFLAFFEERGPPAHALRIAGSSARRHLDAAERRRHAAVQAVLPGPREAAGDAARVVAALLSDARHRGGRQHEAPPHLLRDARQLLASATTSSARRRVRLGALDRTASASIPS